LENVMFLTSNTRGNTEYTMEDLPPHIEAKRNERNERSSVLKNNGKEKIVILCLIES